MKYLFNFLIFSLIPINIVIADLKKTIELPIEVFGPTGSEKSIEFNISNPESITHLYIRVNSLGYHNKKLDENPKWVKASVKINSGKEILLKHYTGSESRSIIGNPSIKIYGPEKHYGGIGGGFRTVRLTVPIQGLKRGMNTIRFKHKNPDKSSIGFRILELNFVKSGLTPIKNLSQLKQRLYYNPDHDFIYDNPKLWKAPLELKEHIIQGEKLWKKRNILFDPKLAELNHKNKGYISASCADCHELRGRDLAYFNFSNASIIERSRFHRLSKLQGQQIASYIRNISITHSTYARPWNPPYQPGKNLDQRDVYHWAAGAGIDAVLEKDKDMLEYLLPIDQSASEVNKLIDRKSTLNIREVPIAIALPEWNQWLPSIHPNDALLMTDAVQTDTDGNFYNKPYYTILYEQAKLNPTPETLGKMLSNLKDWSSRGASFYSTTRKFEGVPFRALNGQIWEDSIAFNIPRINIHKKFVENKRVMEKIEMAKQGLLAWLSVKYWEINHGRRLETMSQIISPINYHGEMIDVSENRGWNINSQTVFNRPPHYLSHNSHHFINQDPLIGSYDNNTWYYLNLILNSGYRNKHLMPSHFSYTITQIQKLHHESSASQSFRFWTTMIKMRQLQTNGIYGTEEGLSLRTAQPYLYYGDVSNNTSMQMGVGYRLWRKIAEKFLTDFTEDAKYAVANDWANAIGNETVQARNSTNFSRGKTFDKGPWQGRNIYRLIPLLRKSGVSENILNKLIYFGNKTWPRAKWVDLKYNEAKSSHQPRSSLPPKTMKEQLDGINTSNNTLNLENKDKFEGVLNSDESTGGGCLLNRRIIKRKH